MWSPRDEPHRDGPTKLPVKEWIKSESTQVLWEEWYDHHKMSYIATQDFLSEERCIHLSEMCTISNTLIKLLNIHELHNALWWGFGLVLLPAVTQERGSKKGCPGPLPPLHIKWKQNFGLSALILCWFLSWALYWMASALSEASARAPLMMLQLLHLFLRCIGYIGLHWAALDRVCSPVWSCIKQDRDGCLHWPQEGAAPGAIARTWWEEGGCCVHWKVGGTKKHEC